MSMLLTPRWAGGLADDAAATLRCRRRSVRREVLMPRRRADRLAAHDDALVSFHDFRRTMPF